MPNETLSYVVQLPIVHELLAEIASSKLSNLFEHYREHFMTVSAATTMHHNFTHGLVIHTAEVWEAAKLFHQFAPHSVAYDAMSEGPQAFALDELLVAVVLHDFAKIVQYEPARDHAWTKVRMICNQETWTLRELAKFGIVLTDNELVGLLHAEGGYTEFEVDWRPMSAILHAADLWSSQAMKANWDPAEALNISCPSCDSPMRAINGKNGTFYGCTKYATGCRGTRNANEVPSADAAFGEWLKKMYPLPLAQTPLSDAEIAELPF